MKLTASLVVEKGRLFLPIQSEVEDIAIEMLGDHRQIYFDPIPLTDKLYLKYDRKSNYGWEILVGKY